MHPYPLMISVVYLLTLKAGTEWVFFMSGTINNLKKIHFILRTTFSQFLLHIRNQRPNFPYLVWNRRNLYVSFSHFFSQSLNLSCEFTNSCILKQRTVTLIISTDNYSSFIYSIWISYYTFDSTPKYKQTWTLNHDSHDDLQE